MAMFAVPPLIALLVVSGWGRASTAELAGIREDASFLHVGTRPDGTPRVTALDFLGDSVASAQDRVQEMPSDMKLGSLVVGAILIAMQGAWLWWWARPRLTAQLGRSGPILSALCVVAVVLGTATLFVTGVDWLRWVALAGGAWLITCGISILADDESTERTDRVMVPTVLPFVAIYLAVLAPLDSFYELGAVFRTLTLR